MALKILHAVEFYAPSLGGAQEVVRQVSERLALRGHDVTVATSRLATRDQTTMAGVKIAEFDVSGNAVRGIEGDIAGYRRFVRESHFDVVMAYAAQQWTCDALLDVLDDLPQPTVLAPCGFSALHDSAYATYFAGLREALPRFDALILHSETYQDHVFADEAGAKGLVHIPNAADEREFAEPRDPAAFRSAHGIAQDAPLLLSVGGHTGLKGHAQTMAALRHARTAAGGTLAIIGNTPTGAGCRRLCRARAALTRVARPDRRVLLLDPPREAVLDAYAASDLFVFLSMVECSPLVLFEAMAAGLPFVAADVGNAAEIAHWSNAGVVVPSRRRPDGLVETDPRAAARAIDELLADRGRRAEMAASGRAAWERRFTWNAVASQYEELYQSLAA